MANLLGHESLLDAKILHLDISIGNIMLKMGEDYANGPGLLRSKTKYESWNYEVTRESAIYKDGMVHREDRFDEEVISNFTAYCRPLIPCMQELRKVVFPGGSSWLREHRQLYTKIKSVMEQARKDLVTLE